MVIIMLNPFDNERCLDNERYLPEGARLGVPSNRQALASPETLEAARLNGAILEAAAVRCSPDENGAPTLTVPLGGGTGDRPPVIGVLTRDETVFSDGPVRDIAVLTRVGRPVCFKVLSVSPDGTSARLSRRLAQKECAEVFLSNLTPGDVIPARVTHLEPFGAFVDVGCGIVSMLPIDSLSVSRIDHPKQRVSVGEELNVVVRSVEKREDGSVGRISVSRKELLGTWEENAALFRVGQTVTGVVRSIESYGVFVELTPNLAGLAEVRPDVTVGQTAAVYIKSILPERMKIKLALIDGGPALPTPAPKPPLAEKRHIDRFTYSPACCPRKIETVFS